MEQDGICPSHITGDKYLRAYRRFDTGNAWPRSNGLNVNRLSFISINRSSINMVWLIKDDTSSCLMPDRDIETKGLWE